MAQTVNEVTDLMSDKTRRPTPALPLAGQCLSVGTIPAPTGRQRRRQYGKRTSSMGFAHRPNRWLDQHHFPQA